MMKFWLQRAESDWHSCVSYGRPLSILGASAEGRPTASFIYYFAFGGVRNIAHVSLCVRLSVRSHISKITLPNFAEFSVHVHSDRISVLFWRRCDTQFTSSFVDDVMFHRAI